EEKTATSISISKRRPDRCLTSIIVDLNFSALINYHYTPSNHGVSKNLIRLGVFSKNAIDHDKLKGVLSFQAIGNHVTFYIMKLVSDGLYVMLEIAHIQVPGLLYELVSYLSQLGRSSQRDPGLLRRMW
ncbi:hypothetical protein BCR42DRAFT_339453, partial [Absidia repens]